MVFRQPAMTVPEFRQAIRELYPHVTISVRTVGMHDLARAAPKCLTVTGDRKGDMEGINMLAREAGIVPDNSLRGYMLQAV